MPTVQHAGSAVERVTLADQIIEHGRVDLDELARLVTAADLAQLRDELIEGRKLRAAAEARERYAVDSYIGPNGHRVITQLECRRCDWVSGTSTRVTLGELVRRADEHTEECGR